jgi:GTPase SAR1 family protein
LSKDADKKLQKGLIITDDIAINPILDFNLYRDAITKIITQSYPKFSIGIYGDWGIGKTTLMQSIFNKLSREKENKDNQVILVWFNAWRYEREDHFAIIPLLKTIESAIPPEKYTNLKEAFKEAGIFGLRTSKDIFSSIIGTYLGKETGDLLKSGITDITEKIIPNLKKINELEKNTIYFEGQRKIEREIENLRQKNIDFRIVVFVDDLDRCSPEKVIEVFESIKIFLGLDGFIYILGLSHEKISQLIKKKYGFEKEIEGEHYIKKIVQIPITLPKWDNKDIVELVKDLLDKGIVDNKYKEIINKNIEIISKAIEHSPREIKRFLNNFIVAYEIFSNTPNFKAEELLVLQAIQLRWNSLYNILIKSDNNFREELRKYSQMGEEERFANLDSNEIEEGKKDYGIKIRKTIRNFKEDAELWNFFAKNIYILDNIHDWNIYRRATEISIEPSIKQKDIYEEYLMLLKSGKIDEFNKKRRENEFNILNLVDADLGGADLISADLRGVNLKGVGLYGANLRGANLEGADLGNADFYGADFYGANLRRSDLYDTTLRDTDLREADLYGADLRSAKIIGADLEGINLRGAGLMNSIIIIGSKSFNKLFLDNYTKFDNAIIDDSKFIEYIKRYTPYLPQEKIENKKQLKEKLKELSMDDSFIHLILNVSKLPEK